MIYNNWNTKLKSEISVTNAVHDLISKKVVQNEIVIPNLREAGDLLLFSDYGGDHKQVKYHSYSFFITSVSEASSFISKIRELRLEHFKETRIINYKTLNDKLKLKALPDYLNVYNSIQGLVISILIDKTKTKSIFLKNGFDLSSEELNKFKHYNKNVFEKTIRIVHFICLILNGVCASDQKVFWITDEDEIIANEKMHNNLREISTGISQQYLNFPIGFDSFHLKSFTDTNKIMEEFCGIPDLISGALAQLQNHIPIDIPYSSLRQFYHLDDNLKRKDQILGNWLSDQFSNLPLKKYLFAITDFENQLKVSRITYKQLF